MKTKIFIFSSLLCLCGAVGAVASECTGEGCNIEPLTFEEFEWSTEVTETEKPTAIILATPATTEETPTWMESDPNAAAMPTAENFQIPERNVNAKLLTIKPVPEDERPALWDGTSAQSKSAKAVKTVDWRNGVPIWDESINSYKYKDFSDWFLEPSPEIYLRESDAVYTTNTDAIELYQQNMEDATTTRARVEELLAPRKPSENLWFTNISENEKLYAAQDMSDVIIETFGELVIDEGCPFETETECEIWRRKPIVRETVSPRSARLRDTKVEEFVHAADCNIHITANETVSAPLLDRYKMLMRSAQACCTDGMAYALKQAGASDGLVYKFLADDANFYGFGARCLMMTDHDLDTQYPNTATAVVAADVRNGCLCRGRQWFQAMLAPFEQVYSAIPEFRNAQFNYTYKDGLQREITVSVNNDVQNVLKQLAQCP